MIHETSTGIKKSTTDNDNNWFHATKINWILNSALYTVPQAKKKWCARFNSSGNRLIYSGFEPEIVVYDHPTWQRKYYLGNVKFSAPNFASKHDSCVFGGINDDLVIAGSGDREDANIYIWSLPDFKYQDLTVNQPLCILFGHEKTTINCVRYSNEESAIISSYENGSIKVWTNQYFSTIDID